MIGCSLIGSNLGVASILRESSFENSMLGSFEPFVLGKVPFN